MVGDEARDHGKAVVGRCIIDDEHAIGGARLGRDAAKRLRQIARVIIVRDDKSHAGPGSGWGQLVHGLQQRIVDTLSVQMSNLSATAQVAGSSFSTSSSGPKARTRPPSR